MARALGRKKDEAGRLLVPGLGAQFSRVWASPRGSWRALPGLALCSRELLWETADELGDGRTQQQGLCLMRRRAEERASQPPGLGDVSSTEMWVLCESALRLADPPCRVGSPPATPRRPVGQVLISAPASAQPSPPLPPDCSQNLS